MSNDIPFCFQPSFPDKLPPPLITRLSTFRLCPHFTFQLVPEIELLFHENEAHTWGKEFHGNETLEFLDGKSLKSIIHFSLFDFDQIDSSRYARMKCKGLGFNLLIRFFSELLKLFRSFLDLGLGLDLIVV